jgi:hypothetical protein
MRHASVVLVTVLLTSIAGCGSNKASPTPSPSPTPTPQPTVLVTNLTITGDAKFTTLNQVRQFTATAHMSDGSVRDVTAEAAWSSSNVGVVTVSSRGEVTAAGSGLATISATALGSLGLLDVSVVPPSDATRIPGLYRLAFTASPACSGLPDWARHREYDAAIDQSGAESPGEVTNLTLTVQIQPGTAPQFTGSINGSRVGFFFPTQPSSGFYCYYYTCSGGGPVFSETIDGSSQFTVQGEVTGTKGAAPGVITGTLKGAIQAVNPSTKATIAECTADQFTLTRQ